MAKLTQASLRALIRNPGRHSDGGGLYFRVLGAGKAYFVYRYRIGGRERETSLGPFPELTLAEAREKHAALRKRVKVDKADPVADRKAAAKAVQPSAVPTFGQMADAYIETHEGVWRNPKHRRQWVKTLGEYSAKIRDLPVDEVKTADVLSVLKPIWNDIPESASRLRGRIQSVLEAAQALGHIHEDRANPARWKGHLDHLLPKPGKLTRGHQKALPYGDVPEFVARLAATRNTAAKALIFTILTAARTSETLGMTWDEIDSQNAIWNVPAARMKMQKPHAVPLSDAALAILRAQETAQGKNPFVFPGGRPRQPLSAMAMAMLLRRIGVAATVHGFRSSFRMWAGDVAHIPFEVAEQCLAHAIGNETSQSYNRGDMLERRRPVMQSWCAYVTGKANTKVVAIVSERRKR
jgi:integrase